MKKTLCSLIDTLMEHYAAFIERYSANIREEETDFIKLNKIARQYKFKSTYQELKSHIHDAYFMKMVTYLERGIGKTTSLIKLSVEYNIPIFSMFSKEKKHISKQAKKLGIKYLEIIDSILYLEEMYPKEILVDEMTTSNDSWEDIEKHLLNIGYKIVGIKGEKNGKLI